MKKRTDEQLKVFYEKQTAIAEKYEALANVEIHACRIGCIGWIELGEQLTQLRRDETKELKELRKNF